MGANEHPESTSWGYQSLTWINFALVLRFESSRCIVLKYFFTYDLAYVVKSTLDC